MLETHPFGVFAPSKTKYLILGGFTARITDKSYDWFYGSKRNQFWPIIEAVYKIKLKDRIEKQKLFTKLGIAIADIIWQCERRANNNLDINLTNIIFNTKAVKKILKENKIRKIFFSSRFVEHLFKKQFRNIISNHPKIELLTLPSPSPRYAIMSKVEKIKKYKKILPKLKI